jgi:hypothetical protein
VHFAGCSKSQQAYYWFIFPAESLASLLSRFEQGYFQCDSSH